MILKNPRKLEKMMIDRASSLRGFLRIMQMRSLRLGLVVLMLYSTSSSLRVNMDRTRAYSMMALKIMKIQVMMNPSMALSFVDPDDGALVRTLLNTLMMYISKMTRRDILPGMTFGSMMKLIHDTRTNRQHGM